MAADLCHVVLVERCAKCQTLVRVAVESTEALRKVRQHGVVCDGCREEKEHGDR